MPRTEYIEKMFDSIAPEYDALNHILSLNIDKGWRKKAVKALFPTRQTGESRKVLDVACGTGDLSIAIAKYHPSISVTGVDLSEGMMEMGRKKILAEGLEGRITMEKGDCRSLPFGNNSFDGVCVAFGVRNFEFREECLKEMLRVLKPDGNIVILELSIPKNALIRKGFNLYFTRILPLIGKKVSGDNGAYSYLPASVINFPSPEEFVKTLRACGFANVCHKALSLGICRMFTAVKR